MDIQLICPHCQVNFIVNQKEINCAIFRHAVYRTNLQPINPHETKNNCDELLKKNLIYGCSKPFRIVCINNIFTTEICDYI